VDYAGGHFTFAFASKNVYQAALDLTLDSAKFTVPVELIGFPKATILGLTGSEEGMIINDSDDHVPVIYENGKWYPIQLGVALQ
ncbi:MAG: hypothetical protein ABF572_11575, partial [Gluconobacter sp.]|uniref:hypothetical protein n=1 Tax=Gluconobacter sp. TaxID=1876758 RepID=UPI0039EA4F89